MVNLKDKWGELTRIQRGVLILAIIFAVFALVLIFTIQGPLTKTQYEGEISGIDEQFVSIINNRTLYSTAQNPWREDEASIKLMLEKLGNMEKRGIPPEYKEFHQLYTNSIQDYLLWSNTANDSYENKYYEERNKSREIWNNTI